MKNPSGYLPGGFLISSNIDTNLTRCVNIVILLQVYNIDTESVQVAHEGGVLWFEHMY